MNQTSFPRPMRFLRNGLIALGITAFLGAAVSPLATLPRTPSLWIVACLVVNGLSWFGALLINLRYVTRDMLTVAMCLVNLISLLQWCVIAVFALK